MTVPADVWGVCEANVWHIVPSTYRDDVRVAIHLARPIARQDFQLGCIRFLLHCTDESTEPKLHEAQNGFGKVIDTAGAMFMLW
eukprot:350468-Chlamydomonas_euryale.AAC.14